MKVAVLGCGPAGLLAAYAAEQLGHEVSIHSIKGKSELFGAQYLHDPIPGLTNEEADATLTYLKRGSKEGYAAKVYGDPAAPCSWDKFPEGEYPAWSLQRLYDRLWARYEGRVADAKTHLCNIRSFASYKEAVISSIPAQFLCQRGHGFPFQRVAISRGSSGARPGEIIYSGDEADIWYRTSNLFESLSTEFPSYVTAPIQGIKPLDTNCDCMANVIRVGRFGNWRRGVLVHHAYEEARSALLQML